MRVVRFYQSCSSPSPPSPPPPLHPLPGPLPPLPVHFRLANSSPSSSPTSARSGHCWTSTAGFRSEWARLDLNRKGLSAVRTAGPQPGTSGAQWAPLDLILGPSELSEHRWTSTWDPPSSVSTASSVSTTGPQPPDRMPEAMPDRTPDRMSERMPVDMPGKVPECLPDRMPEDMPDRMSEGIPDKVPQCLPDRTPEDLPEHMPDRMPEGMPDRTSDRMPEGMPDKVPECAPEDLPDRMSEDMPEDMPDRVPQDMPMPEDMPDRMPEDVPDKMPEDMSDRMPEDLPVTKRINVMVGITRSEVIFVCMYQPPQPGLVVSMAEASFTPCCAEILLQGRGQIYRFSLELKRWRNGADGVRSCVAFGQKLR